MSASPRKKKLKTENCNSMKRENDTENSPRKRLKHEQQAEDIQTKKRKNFVLSCEKVSYQAYFDYQSRLLLTILPSCVIGNCKHNDKNSISIKALPAYAEESFKIEMKSNTWSEALEVCSMCIGPSQFLSANVLKDVVEIMMNADDDEFASHTIDDILQRCQQILSQNLSMHPPCIVKSLRKCYNAFLTDPMDNKDKTFSNRTEYGCDKGIVKYCLNRLEYELSLESKDGPLVDKQGNIPEEMKQSVKGLHWQKEKFEILESLGRLERIKRIMSVLDSINLLLQYDLAIWHSRYTNNLGSHIMRSHKPLMAFILWSNNVLYTGAVNNNCRQILRIFIYIVHLEYPDDYVKIMLVLLNTMIQTFYICEHNSNSDYPNIGKYCTIFANEFYKMMSEMPTKTILRVLETIQPSYMQYLVASIHLKTILGAKEDDIIKIFINYVEKRSWQSFPKSDEKPTPPKKPMLQQKKVKNMTKYLIKKIRMIENSSSIVQSKTCGKFDPNVMEINEEIDQNHVIITLYIALEAYLDAFSVQQVQETLDSLNEKIDLNCDSMDTDQTEFCTYTVSEHFIKKYRSIYQMLKELMLKLQEMRSSDTLPDNFKIFENIGLLGF